MTWCIGPRTIQNRVTPSSAALVAVSPSIRGEVASQIARRRIKYSHDVPANSAQSEANNHLRWRRAPPELWCSLPVLTRTETGNDFDLVLRLRCGEQIVAISEPDSSNHLLA
jgi:hypothetical protein